MSLKDKIIEIEAPEGSVDFVKVSDVDLAVHSYKDKITGVKDDVDVISIMEQGYVLGLADALQWFEEEFDEYV